MSTALARTLPTLARSARPSVRVARRGQPSSYFRSMPVLRAQAEEGKPAEEKGIQRRSEQAGVVQQAPWDSSWGLGMPSFGRMGQMMRAMEEEMDQLTRAFGMPSLTFDLPSVAPAIPANARSLACDVQDKGDHIEVTADVPGMTKDDIKVTVSPDKVLQISGERKYEKEEGKEGEGVWRVERSYGSFVRRFRLPDNVDPEGIKAQVKDGVLRLSVPKTEEAKPKMIEVAMED